MAITDWIAGLTSRFQTFSQTSAFRLLVAITASSAFTTFSLLTFQSLQRAEHRRALRDSIEAQFDSRPSSRASRGRPSTAKNTVDDGHDDDDEEDDDEGRRIRLRKSAADGSSRNIIDEELEDYTDPIKARKLREKLNNLNNINASAQGSNDTTRVIDEEIIREQLARNIAFLGEDAVDKIRKSFVIVVGIGGVGSAAAAMLARSGVGRIRIIDFDQVSLSSLNRHTVATLADVGTSKVICCKTHFERICPWVQVEAVNELFSLEAAERLLSGNPDYVVDCIDNITTKVDLLAYCRKNDLKVFSAMGAGGKYDPSRIQISDISTTFEDPLARAVRVRLKKEGVISGVPVVYSTERPSTLGKLLPLPDDEYAKGAVHELSALEAFRVRILPVLGPLPCMFGQAAAAYIIAMLAGNVPIQPLAVKNRIKIYHRLHNDLAAREQRLTGANKIPVNEEDMAYIFEELHRGRSAIAPEYTVPARPSMCRWSMDQPVRWDNLIVLEKDEAMKHEAEVLIAGKRPEDVWNVETVKLFEERRELERKTRDFRLL